MKKRLSISVHPAGAVVFALAFLLAPSSQVLASVLALALHEGGHLLTLLFCGACDCRIELTPFGGMADSKSFERLSPFRQILCAVSGPLVSLTAFLLGPHSFFQTANLSLFMVNMLPVWPLDGARMITAIASAFGWENLARKVMSIFSWICGAALSYLGLYGAWHGLINPTLLAAGPYLCYASRTGNVSQRIRSVEQLQRQFADGRMLPVRLFVCSQEAKRAHVPAFLGRSCASCAQALVTVNAQNGRIVDFQTEHQLLEEIVGGDQVDKAPRM